jgi:hypothetical protein
MIAKMFMAEFLAFWTEGTLDMAMPAPMQVENKIQIAI